jgi:hypothetical protein
MLSWLSSIDNIVSLTFGGLLSSDGPVAPDNGLGSKT